jgi:tetratricopeptide (TPR) repeat protein
MAEALMAKGDYPKAIAYYEKSLALNPKNENANVMITKMKEKKK